MDKTPKWPTPTPENDDALDAMLRAEEHRIQNRDAQRRFRARHPHSPNGLAKSDRKDGPGPSS